MGEQVLLNDVAHQAHLRYRSDPDFRELADRAAFIADEAGESVPQTIAAIALALSDGKSARTALRGVKPDADGTFVLVSREDLDAVVNLVERLASGKDAAQIARLPQSEREVFYRLRAEADIEMPRHLRVVGLPGRLAEPIPTGRRHD